MKVIIHRNSPRATTFLGRVNILPGVHVYDISEDDFKKIQNDDAFEAEIASGMMNISSEENAETEITAESIETIAETASLSELENIASGKLDKEAKKAIKAAISNRKKALEDAKNKPENEGSE